MNSITMLLYAVAVLMPATEVPDFNITPKQPDYKDFHFEVYWEPEKLMHNQYEIYRVAIYISPGARTNIDRNSYLAVLNDRIFICSAELAPSPLESVPINLRKIKDRKTMLYTFRINPDFIQRSWFNYQIVMQDGSVEMNCELHLSDFIPARNGRTEHASSRPATAPAKVPSTVR